MNQLLSWQLLAQDDGSGAAAAAAATAGVILLVELVLVVAMLAGLWAVFAKAGKPGWAAIIPIYNAVVLMEISGKPIWWVLLLFIPCVNIVIQFLVMMDLAKNFGKGAGFAIGMLFLPFVFIPILGFGDAQYRPVVQQ